MREFGPVLDGRLAAPLKSQKFGFRDRAAMKTASQRAAPVPSSTTHGSDSGRPKRSMIVLFSEGRKLRCSFLKSKAKTDSGPVENSASQA
jgi:hypothetical protein